jgi:hypothetical protein
VSITLRWPEDELNLNKEEIPLAYQLQFLFMEFKVNADKMKQEDDSNMEGRWRKGESRPEGGESSQRFLFFILRDSIHFTWRVSFFLSFFSR